MISRAATITADDIARLRMRRPEAFGPPVWRRLRDGAIAAVFIALAGYGFVHFDISPVRIWNGLDKLGLILGKMFPPSGGGAVGEFLYAILETLAMATVGTLLAAIIALPLAFLAARNVVAARIVRFLARRSFDVLRGVDQMVWALVFVRAVGLGPLAGILAIMVSDIGTLAKLFSESIENIDRRPIDGVRSAGGSTVQTLRFGVIPQVMPMIVSSALYLFESNTRSATILGIVGAGGIGYQLADRIRAFRWDEACLILILILVTVYAIDLLSKTVRMAIIGDKSWRP